MKNIPRYVVPGVAFLCLMVGLLATELAWAQDAVKVRRPNILFAISDDQSQMHAGAYGDKSTRTPAFDRIAKEGVLFNYAYCAAPSCAPSRAAILTGKPIWQLEEGGILFGVLKPKFPLFNHALEDAGYESASTGKTWGPGRYDKAFKRPLFAKIFNKIKIKQRRPGLNANDYAANFQAFLKQRDKGKPFFFWYGSSEPHQSYNVGGWKQAGKKLEDALVPPFIPDDPVTRGEFLDYSVEVEHFDQHLARMIKMLEEAGELDNTLIVVTSDHGNPMPRSKCSLYDSGTRVPLAARYPKMISAGRKVDDLVGLWDLAPTFLELAGVDIPKGVAGKSLIPILAAQESGQIDKTRDFVVTAFERHVICRRDGVGYPMRCIRTHKWAYIRNYEPDRWPVGDPDYIASHQGFYGDCDRGETKKFILSKSLDKKILPYYLRCFARRPAEELYDMEKDPHQLNNLASDSKHAELKKELASRMETFLKQQKDPRMEGKKPWDTYPFSDPRIFKNPNWRTEGHAWPLKSKK